MLCCAALVEASAAAPDALWEIALKKTVKLADYDFEPPVRLVCEKFGIRPPTEEREIGFGDTIFTVYGFMWPEDAAAFFAHFWKTDYAPRVVHIPFMAEVQASITGS